MDLYSGPIRFHGGSLHNQIIHIKTWTRWIDVEPDDDSIILVARSTPPNKLERYDLKAIQIRDAVFYEYVHPEQEVAMQTDSTSWDVIGYCISPEQDLE